jgi:hypothetical protein
MTRRFTNELINALSTSLPDNETGLITPAMLRSAITDTIMSLRPAYSALVGDNQATPKTVLLSNAAWTPLNVTGLFSSVQNSDIAELEGTVATGKIKVKLDSYVHFASAQLTVTGPNGRILDLAIGVGVTPLDQFTTIELVGAGTWQQVVTQVSGRPTVDTEFALLGKWFGGAATDTLTIYNTKFITELVSTRALA